MSAPRRLATYAIGAFALSLSLAGCSFSFGGDDEPLEAAEASVRLDELASEIEWTDNLVTRSASIAPPSGANLANTLPPLDEFPIVVEARGADDVVEVWSSTEKSGEDTDGWMTEATEAFNESNPTLADGSSAGVDLRSIASGTGYQFIARGDSLPQGFSPSNELWTQMSAEFETITPISDRTVSNVAGIVMKDDKAEELNAEYGDTNAATLVDAVLAGDLVMGYTDPFASSTGLNFLVTVLDAIAEGDEANLTSPDVASVFEQFQAKVPFVALTTLQLRDSVESDTGTLDAFVMEWQTFANTDTLDSGYTFIPFGAAHNNPLVGVGDLSATDTEVLTLFSEFVQQPEWQDRSEELGFDPAEFSPTLETPSGAALIEAQNVWKDKKDGGRRVATVFVIDKSGSMSGSRIAALQKAMLSSREFIKPSTSVGVVEFDDGATKRMELGEFDLNQQAQFAAIAEDLSPSGGTAMYDGIVLGLSMLDQERQTDPEVKPLMVVLTDGETTDGLEFADVSPMIEGLRIPIYTVGFEADLDELGLVSSLVEAASIDASEDDVEFKIAALFNAGG